MRIVYLINAPGPRLSGAGRHMFVLARHDLERGAEVWVGAPEGSGVHAVAEDMGAHPFATPMTASLGSIRDLRARIASIDPDIVHAMSFAPLTLAGLPRRFPSDRPRTFASILVDPESSLPMARTRFRPVVMWLRNQAARRDASKADAVFAVSEKVALALARIGATGNIVVARDGLDLPGLHARAAVPLSLPDGRPRIGCACAELAASKGVGYLVEAFARIAPRHPEAVLLFAGDPHPSINLPKLAADLGVAERVHMLGFLEDTAPFFPALDVYVMPSLSEGLNTSVLEASALGAPIVACDVGGLSEAAIADETGLLVPPADAGALAEAVERLLGDLALAARLARNARERMEREFDVEGLYALTDAEYDRALAAMGSESS